MADPWEIEYFGHLGNNPNALSPAGDGYTLLQEFQMGRNPLDFYQGKSPNLTIVSGNQQVGLPNTLLPHPLVVSVSAPGIIPITNAPVTFSVPTGQGQISADATGQTLAQSLNLRVNAQGQAQVYLLLPTANGVSTVSAAAGVVATKVNFSETAGPNVPITPGLIAGGLDYYLIVRADGTLAAAGKNQFGQLGLTTGADVTAPTLVPGVTQAQAAAAGFTHSMVLNQDGTVMAFGGNDFGELGDGTLTDHSTPSLVPGLTGVSAVAAGENFSVALKKDGSIWVWGQVGQGKQVSVPTQVAGLTGIQTVTAGRDFVVALQASGSLLAWGSNRWGQLGNGTTVDQASLSAVSNLTGIKAIVAGAQHVLALDSSGSVWGWGEDAFAQAGNPSLATILVPQKIGSIASGVRLVAGWNHSLVSTGSSLLAFGANDDGQLGDGSTIDQLVPETISLSTAALTAGADTSLALQSNRTLLLWGRLATPVPTVTSY